MYIVSKEMEIAGSHRLNLPYDSKCQNTHGHNWVVKVWCKSENLNDSGMVVDFAHIKREIHGKLDHQHINDIVEVNPTAENLARWICERVPTCFKVEIWESQNNYCCYEVEVPTTVMPRGKYE